MNRIDMCACDTPWHNLPHDILICLGIVYHNTLEAHNCHPIVCHDIFQIFLKKILQCNILKLHVTTCNHEHFAVLGILYIACHCNPLYHVLKHFLRVSHITSLLDMFHKLHPIIWYVYWHSENKVFIFGWFQGIIVMHIDPKWSLSTISLSMILIPQGSSSIGLWWRRRPTFFKQCKLFASRSW